MSTISERITGALQTFTSGDTLKAKVLRGGAWLATGSVAEQLARFGRTLILTRLLAPEAFGTMAIVSSAASIVSAVSEMGVKESLVQNPRGGESNYASAAWWLALGRAAAMYSTLFVLAPWIATFYGNHELATLMRVVSIAVLLDGALSSKAYVAMKQMNFRKWAGINHGGAITGIVITLTLSYFMRDVWALVLGFVAESGARCVLSYILCPYLPSLRWDKHAMRDLLQFSRGLFGLSFLNMVFARADVFVLAKLFPAATLGIYVMAIYLLQTPVNFVTNLLGQVLLPTLSEVRGDDTRANRILLHISSLIALLGMPAILFICFYGRSLLTLIYGAKYAAAGPALTAAAWVVVINLLNAQITTVFYAKGKPQLHRFAVALMALVMVLMVYPMAKVLGIAGGQVACLVAVTGGFVFQVVRIHRLTGLDLNRYARNFLVPVGISLGVVVAYLGGRMLSVPERPMANLLVGFVGCVVAYGCAGAMFLLGEWRPA